MVTRQRLGRALLGREVAVAFAVVAALYLVRFVGVQPLQVPAYLLIVTYDVVEVAVPVPVLTPYHPVAFPVFLYLVAVVGAAAARWLRPGAGGAVPRAAGGVCLVVGSLSLLFGAAVGGPLVAPSDNPTPLAITGATGVVLLVVGWWLLGRPTGRAHGPSR